MTPGAQQALRRTMEIFSNTTRFCLACNMSNKIIEPIQSRCAILRYAKLRDTEILKRLLEICQMEKVRLVFRYNGLGFIHENQVEYNDDGLTALIFTSEGDMRQAINNLQSTFSGFGFVSGDNVFKVCDQPHPIIVQTIIRECVKSNVEGAMEKLSELWEQGYSAVDIVVTLFRVVKTFDEYVPLIIFINSPLLISNTDCRNIQNSSTSKYVKWATSWLHKLTIYAQEIGFTHMRILEGVGTLIQLGGLVARLCKMVSLD